jgi:prepilin-type processing-associated H-X9-DG protein
VINGDNLHALYSFHPGGAQVAMVDGSIQFLPESIPTETMLALITRELGDVTDGDTFR